MKRLKSLSLKYFHVIRKEIKVIEFSWDLILRKLSVDYTQKGKVYVIFSFEAHYYQKDTKKKSAREMGY